MFVNITIIHCNKVFQNYELIHTSLRTLYNICRKGHHERVYWLYRVFVLLYSQHDSLVTSPWWRPFDPRNKLDFNL